MNDHWPAPRRYTEEEAKEILTRAISQQEGAGGFTRADLEQMASELGISQAQLAAAEADFLAPPPPSAELAQLRKAFLAERRRKAIGNMAAMATVLVLLAAISMLELPFSGLAGIVLFFVFLSSIDTFKAGVSALFGGDLDEDEEKLEAAFDAWLERHHERHARLESPKTPRLP
mgnify:CR=1 FL=1